MSERANELPDGWRRDGDGTAYGPGGMEVAKIQYGERAGLWAIHPPGNEGCPRPRYFATEAGAIARAVELTRPSEGQLRVEVNGLDVAVSREPAPEPWTPKDGERVRVAMADGTEAICTVDDSRPEHGTVVGVRFPGMDKRRFIARSWLRPHPDPRDAEIERLRAQVGEQSREIHGLRGEVERLTRERDALQEACKDERAGGDLLTTQLRDALAEIKRLSQPLGDSPFTTGDFTVKPTAAPLEHGMNCDALIPGNDEACTCGLKWRIALQTEQTMHAAWRKRAEEAEDALLAAKPAAIPSGMQLVPIVPTEAMLREAWADAHAEDAAGVWREMLAAAPKIGAALLPDPARAAEAEKALKRQEWIEGTEADVFRGRSADGAWAWTVLSQAAERLGESVESYAAAIDAAMARHPLTREGE